MKQMKRSLPLLLALAMLLSLTACGETRPDPDKPVVLRVLTESVRTRIGYQRDRVPEMVQAVVSQYQENHESVEILIEQLPSESQPEERNARLEQLRTEIMAGKGPDLFVLPTSRNSLLFPDVAQAMHNGMFYDVSGLYDADENLDKAELCAAVMDAGTVEDHRYVLPLWYDVPTVYVDQKALNIAGLDLKEMASSGFGLFRETLGSSDESWVRGLWCVYCYRAPFCGFSALVDHGSGSVLLTEEEAAAFLGPYAEMKRAGEAASWTGNHLDMYLFQEKYCLNESPLHAGMMCEAVEIEAIAQSFDSPVEIFPLRTMDGDVTAEIQYWGAVSANCRYPETAYDILRSMLSEDVQWQQSTVLGDTNKNDLIANGWPVRYSGFVETLWAHCVEYLRSNVKTAFPEMVSRARSILYTAEVTEDDIPALLEPVDIARFPIPGEYYVIKILMREDIAPQSAAQDLFDALQWHLDEG